MFTTRGFKRAIALLGMLSAVMAGGLVGTDTASAEGEPGITWPTFTELNPTTTPYELATSYDGSGFLFVLRQDGERRLRRIGVSDVVSRDVAVDPYVIWSAGLTSGAQYDVKSFTITARYWDIR